MAQTDMGLLQYLAVLENQEQEHLKALEELKIAIAHARRAMEAHGIRADLPAPADNNTPEETAKVADGPYVGMGVEGASLLYLREAGRALKTPQICDGLLSGGLVSTAKNFHSTVFSSLRRLAHKGLIEKVGAGKWCARAPVEPTLLPTRLQK